MMRIRWPPTSKWVRRLFWYEISKAEEVSILNALKKEKNKSCDLFFFNIWVRLTLRKKETKLCRETPFCIIWPSWRKEIFLSVKMLVSVFLKEKNVIFSLNRQQDLFLNLLRMSQFDSWDRSIFFFFYIHQKGAKVSRLKRHTLLRRLLPSHPRPGGLTRNNLPNQSAHLFTPLQCGRSSPSS